MKNIEEEGIWFLPENPEKQLYGKLTFSINESPKLFLLEHLKEIEFDNNIPFKLEFDIINGTLVNGENVTLCHCYQPIGFKTGMQISKIYARYLLIGHHFKSLEDILFKGVSLRYKNLEEWINLLNFEISWDTNPEKTQIQEINVKQKTLEPLELGRLLDFSLVLYDKPVSLLNLELAAFFKNIGRQITLEENKEIIFKSDTERCLDDLIKVMNLFEELLTFASGQITYPYEIKSTIIVKQKEFTIPENIRNAWMLGYEIHRFGDELKPIEEEKEKAVTIKIYFKSAESEHLNLKFDWDRVLFNFKNVKDKFDEILQKWEMNSQKLEPILDIYLRLTYIPKRHINDFFLSLAQAIEAFHSVAHDGRYINKNVYKKIIRKTLEEAVNSIPDEVVTDKNEENIDLREYKRILKEEKLSHLNNYSLRERLAEIIREYKSCLPDNFFQSLEEQENFLKVIRKTRNYLTHLSSNKSKDVASGKELMIISMKLKVILEVCLLKQLGLNDSDIKKNYINKF